MALPLPSRLWSCSEMDSGFRCVTEVKQELADELREERLREYLEATCRKLFP